MFSIHRLPSAKPEAQPADAGTCRCGSRCESCSGHVRVEPAVVFSKKRTSGSRHPSERSRLARRRRAVRIRSQSRWPAQSLLEELSQRICECICEAFVHAADRNLPLARLLGAERQCARRRRARGCTDVPRALSVSGTAQNPSGAPPAQCLARSQQRVRLSSPLLRYHASCGPPQRVLRLRRGAPVDACSAWREHCSRKSRCGSVRRKRHTQRPASAAKRTLSTAHRQRSTKRALVHHRQ